MIENLNISLELTSNQADNSIVSVLVDDEIVDQILLSTTDIIKKDFSVSIDQGNHKLRLLVDPYDGNVIHIRAVGINGKIFTDTDVPRENRYLKTHGFYKQPHESDYLNVTNFGRKGEFYLPFETPILDWLLNAFPDEAGESFDFGVYAHVADYDPDSGIDRLEYILSVCPWRR